MYRSMEIKLTSPEQYSDGNFAQWHIRYYEYSKEGISRLERDLNEILDDKAMIDRFMEFIKQGVVGEQFTEKGFYLEIAEIEFNEDKQEI